MNRCLTVLEKQQLDEVIQQIIERIDILKNRTLNGNKYVKFEIRFAKNKKKNNKLYLLLELGFNFKDYIISRLIALDGNHCWFAENIPKLKLFIENDDLSGATVVCDDGFSYVKDYITVFGVKINN